MEQCSRQCIRRTFYAVMIGVSPIVICLLLIGLARLILHRVEIAYYRRQKSTDRWSPVVSYQGQSGRLALSYTPVSNAELQRIIQGDHQSQLANESPPRVIYRPSMTRKTPKFIKSILPRREPSVPLTSILANLVIRRDAIDPTSLADALTPIETPCQPTFSIVNEQGKRRPSIITIKRESTETTTLAPINNNNDENSLNTTNLTENKPKLHSPLMATTRTKTTTVVVERFLDYHSVSSLPYAVTVLNSISESDNDSNSEINKDNEEQY